MKNFMAFRYLTVIVFVLISLATTHFSYAQNLQISGGNNFSISLCSDGQVFAWGKNDAGQLGRNSSNVKYAAASSSTPQIVYRPGANTLKMKQADAGSGNTGIVLACDGSVWQWGGNCGNGNIGNGVTGASCSGTPTDGSDYYSSMQRVVGGAQGGAFLTNITYINASTQSSFAVETSGKVLAWGNNSTGALGNGAASNAGNTYTPSYVLSAAATPLTGISIVEGTDYGGYALSTTGFVYSWGYNTNNDLGRTPTGANQYYATRVKAWDYTLNDGTLVDLSNIVKMTGGDTHGLAIDANGDLWSWGGDWGPGQRGGGSCGCNNPPYAIKVISPLATCAINAWKIGPWITGAKEISAGQQHSIVLLNNGKVVTFGSNASGQLGDGTTTASGCPVYVKTAAATDLTNIVSVSDGDLWSFALTSSGQVYVWGENGNGELGIPGNTTDQTYAYLNPAIPTACTGSLLPCPVADLGADVLKCPGSSVTLLAGDNGDTYEYSWYSGPAAAGPWTLIGSANRPYAAGAGATITVTTPLYYRVVIHDTRAYVADLCGPCVDDEDIMHITDRTPPLSTSSAGVCGGTDVCFQMSSTGAIDNNAFDWYATQVSVPKLNSSGTVNPFCTPKGGLVLNGSNYEIWVDDMRTFQSTVGPTTNPCAPTGGSAGNKYQQEFVVYSDIVITQVDVYYKTYSVPGGPVTYDAANVKVYSNDPNKNSTSTDGVNALTGLVSTTYGALPRTSTAFAPYTMTGLNLALTGSPTGTKYWLEVSGLSNGEFGEFTCAAAYPYADAVPSQTVVQLKGSTTSAQAIQQVNYNALAYNWTFTYQDGYPCGRFKVTAPSGTVVCLPVNYIYFDGVNEGNINHIRWATSSEQSSNYFELERSYDGVNWVTINKVKASGNANSVKEYSYDDIGIKSGTIYYRIVETDFEGATSSTNVISITSKSEVAIMIIPNPNNGRFEITTNGTLGSNTLITVTDAVGRVVNQFAGNFSEKNLTQELVLTHLEKGLYFIRVSDGKANDVQKLVIE
jgi:alpha-tubulin suppressor-like RCC1 family protein